MADADFQVGQGFEQGELSGNVRLGKFEAHYEELFAEALEDGVITDEERARLTKAADAFGLDRERVFALERALTAAWEGRHRIVPSDVVTTGASVEPPAPSLRPLPSEDEPQLKALRKRVAELEAEVARLTTELEEAKSHIAVEVDFSDLAQKDIPLDSPDDIHRRIRHDLLRPSLNRRSIRAELASRSTRTSSPIAVRIPYAPCVHPASSAASSASKNRPTSSTPIAELATRYTAGPIGRTKTPASSIRRATRWPIGSRYDPSPSVRRSTAHTAPRPRAAATRGCFASASSRGRAAASSRATWPSTSSSSKSARLSSATAHASGFPVNECPWKSVWRRSSLQKGSPEAHAVRAGVGAIGEAQADGWLTIAKKGVEGSCQQLNPGVYAG